MIEMSAHFNAATYRLGWMLVHSIWQATLAAGVLAIVLRAGRGLSSAVRYAASYAALLVIAGASLATLMLANPPADVAVAHRAREAVRISAMPPADMQLPDSTVASAVVNGPATKRLPERVLPWLVGAWAAGVLVLSIWQFGGWLLLQRWRRSAEAAEADLQERVDRLAWKMHVRRVVLKLSRHVDVPLVVGVWRPVILAPISILTDLPAYQLEAILAHELAHIRRLDYVANLIHVAIETLLFYHPAIWWISRQIRLERECCCDELAASACADRAEYVKALTAMEQTRGPRLAPAITGRGGRGELLTRVRRLLGVSEGSARSTRFEMRSWITSALLLSVLLGIGAGGQILRAQQEPAVPSTQPIPFRGPAMDPQPFAAQPTATSIMPEDLVPGPVEDYKISRNDLIQVTIADLPANGPETKKVSRVSESGFISLPWIGQIKAEGLSETQTEQAIANAFRAKQLLANPQVTVTVVEARGRTFTAIGAIARPGLYQIKDSRMTLLDALAIAGGAEQNASVTVHRHVGDAGQQRLIEIPAPAVASGDPQFNIIIRPLDAIVVTAPPGVAASSSGSQAEQEAKILIEQLVQAKIDAKEAQATYGPGHPKVAGANQKVQIIQQMLDDAQLRVGQRGDPPVIEDQPQAAKYYIGGDVDRAGVYSLMPPRNTLSFAITEAGPPPAGKTYYAQIIRRNGNQQQIISNIPLQELLQGKLPDIPLKADDQIMVLDHRTPDAPTTKPSSLRADATRATHEVIAQADEWEAINQRMQQGEPLTPTFVQLMLDSSERLAVAQSEAAVTWPQRVAAAEGHLDRVVQLADIVYKRQGQDTSRVQMSQCNSSVEGAKANVIRVKAAARDAGEPQ